MMKNRIESVLVFSLLRAFLNERPFKKRKLCENARKGWKYEKKVSLFFILFTLPKTENKSGSVEKGSKRVGSLNRQIWSISLHLIQSSKRLFILFVILPQSSNISSWVAPFLSSDGELCAFPLLKCSFPFSLTLSLVKKQGCSIFTVTQKAQRSTQHWMPCVELTWYFDWWNKIGKQMPATYPHIFTINCCMTDKIYLCKIWCVLTIFPLTKKASK